MSFFSRRSESFSVRLELNGEILYEGVSSELACPLQIGRDDGCLWKVPADERSVSVLHAEICIRKKDVVVRDLGSRNGLYHMGRRVAEQKLAPGVQIGIGACRLIAERNQNNRTSRVLPYHRLERLNGSDGCGFYELREESTVIGSGVTDGIQCVDMLVSRRHAEIVRKGDDTCWIKDLGSRNGTLVNGVPLKDTERMLRDGDLITVADVEFRFWDRAVEHVHGRLLLKVCVMLITAAVCGSLYFAYLMFLPSSKSFLRKAQECEVVGDFNGAKAALEEAHRGRGAEHYAAEIARKKKDIARWETALRIWKDAKSAMQTRSWITASKMLGPVLNSAVEYWGWNSTDAPKEKIRARTAKKAIDVFLHARNAFTGLFNENESGDVILALSCHVDRMEKMLADIHWTSDVPTGKLREDMEDQCRRMELLLGCLKEIDDVMASLAVPDRNTVSVTSVMKSFECLRPAIQKMQSICDRHSESAKSAEVLAKKEGRKYVFSPLVQETAQRYLPILKKFLETHDFLTARLTEVVQVTDLCKDAPPLPAESQCSVHPFFAALKYSTVLLLEKLSAEVAPSVRDQIGRLERWKLSGGAEPEALALMADESGMAKVFSVDTLSGARPSSSRQNPCGKYDLLLGVELFAEFVRNADAEMSYPSSVDLGVPEPLIENACRLFAQIDQFKMFLKRDDIRFLQLLDSPSNSLAKIARLAMTLDSKRQLLVDAYWNDAASDRRRRIISKGIAIALDAGRTFGADAAAEIRTDMKSLGDEIRELKGKIASDPDNVDIYRTKILSIGIPGLNGINAYWDQAMRKKGDGK